MTKSHWFGEKLDMLKFLRLARMTTYLQESLNIFYVLVSPSTPGANNCFLDFWKDRKETFGKPSGSCRTIPPESQRTLDYGM